MRGTPVGPALLIARNWEGARYFCYRCAPIAQAMSDDAQASQPKNPGVCGVCHADPGSSRRPEPTLKHHFLSTPRQHETPHTRTWPGLCRRKRTEAFAALVCYLQISQFGTLRAVRDLEKASPSRRALISVGPRKSQRSSLTVRSQMTQGAA